MEIARSRAEKSEKKKRETPWNWNIRAVFFHEFSDSRKTELPMGRLKNLYNTKTTLWQIYPAITESRTGHLSITAFCQVHLVMKDNRAIFWSNLDLN